MTAAVTTPSRRGLGFARDAGWLLGMEMAAIGCDITFAPVLDIDVAGSTIIGDRSFGTTPEDVIAVGTAFIEGLREAGMAAVGKHYPGHGGIAADTHRERVIDPRPFRELREHDLKPFAALADRLGGVMPAHADLIPTSTRAPPASRQAGWGCCVRSSVSRAPSSPMTWAWRLPWPRASRKCALVGTGCRLRHGAGVQ